MGAREGKSDGGESFLGKEAGEDVSLHHILCCGSGEGDGEPGSVGNSGSSASASGVRLSSPSVCVFSSDGGWHDLDSEGAREGTSGGSYSVNSSGGENGGE